MAGSYALSRGLRQGDTLSPYLFILCQDVLSRMIEKEFLEGRLTGIKLNIGWPPLTHIMHADDIVLFSKTTSRDANILNECLEKYCTRSRQLLNRSKSGIIFLKFIQQPRARAMKQILNKKNVKKDAIYLGAPVFTSNNPSKDFKFL